MIDRLQCQSHTRTPWGKDPHRYDYRLRYLFMGLLCISVLAVFITSLVFIGNQAIRNLEIAPTEEGPETSAAQPSPTVNATKTKNNATASATLYYKSGRVT